LPFSAIPAHTTKIFATEEGPRDALCQWWNLDNYYTAHEKSTRKRLAV